MKRKIARLLDLFFFNQFIFWLTHLIYGNHIRVINYHGTSLKDMDNFEKQLEFYKKWYANVNLNDLENFFLSRRRKGRKPGLVITFDDAHRSNYVNALPLLNKHGFTGWFMIPAGVIDYDPRKQKDFIGSYFSEDERQFPDRRFLMNWEEIRLLAEDHVIGCHTFSHHRMRADDSPETLEMEILTARRHIEEKTGRDTSVFCWVGGEEWTYTRSAAVMVKRAGYRFSFMTNTAPVTGRTNPLQIQRTNIEVDNPVYLARFQLGMLMDIFYFFKRRRVNQLTQ